MNRTVLGVALMVAGLVSLFIMFLVLVFPPESVKKQLKEQQQLEQQQINDSMQFFLDTQIKFKKHANGGCFAVWKEYDNHHNIRFNITNVPLGMCSE